MLRIADPADQPLGRRFTGVHGTIPKRFRLVRRRGCGGQVLTNGHDQ